MYELREKMQIANLIANKLYDYQWVFFSIAAVFMILHQYFLSAGVTQLLVQTSFFLSVLFFLLIFCTILKPICTLFCSILDKDYLYAVRLVILIILFSVVAGHLMIREERTRRKIFPFISWLPSEKA